MRLTLPIIFLLSMSVQAYSQDYLRLHRTADSFYGVKNYRAAIPLYKSAALVADFTLKKINSLYSAGCCYSLAGNKDSAFVLLRESIRAGFGDTARLASEEDLVALHGEQAWTALLHSVKEDRKIKHDDPRDALILTDDIHMFWQAYDLAQQDTARRVAIYKKYYFDRGSRGMQDYMGLKVSSINSFVTHHYERPAFYRAIRNNSLKVDSFRPSFYAAFEKLKGIYPQAVFPDIYFIIGTFTSAGTVSKAGLLIGIDQVCKTDDIPVGELNLWEKNNFNRLENLGGIVSHELIHFEQDDLFSLADSTTLLYVLIEGMADFMGEMISGKNINQRLHTWAKGREKKIWQSFTKDMYFSRYSNWMANSGQETPDNPADQGYWIGYQICKAYYDKAIDKRQAIYEMLHFKNARDFLQASGWEEIVEKL